MEREEVAQIYKKQNEEERLLEYLNAHEAFDAIQDEANTLALLDDLSEEVRAGLDRIEALARHRFDYRTEDEIEKAKSPEFRKSV